MSNDSQGSIPVTKAPLLILPGSETYTGHFIDLDVAPSADLEVAPNSSSTVPSILLRRKGYYTGSNGVDATKAGYGLWVDDQGSLNVAPAPATPGTTSAALALGSDLSTWMRGPLLINPDQEIAFREANDSSPKGYGIWVDQSGNLNISPAADAPPTTSPAAPYRFSLRNDTSLWIGGPLDINPGDTTKPALTLQQGGYYGSLGFSLWVDDDDVLKLGPNDMKSPVFVLLPDQRQPHPSAWISGPLTVGGTDSLLSTATVEVVPPKESSQPALMLRPSGYDGTSTVGYGLWVDDQGGLCVAPAPAAPGVSVALSLGSDSSTRINGPLLINNQGYGIWVDQQGNLNVSPAFDVKEIPAMGYSLSLHNDRSVRMCGPLGINPRDYGSPALVLQQGGSDASPGFSLWVDKDAELHIGPGTSRSDTALVLGSDLSTQVDTLKVWTGVSGRTSEWPLQVTGGLMVTGNVGINGSSDQATLFIKQSSTSIPPAPPYAIELQTTGQALTPLTLGYLDWGLSWHTISDRSLKQDIVVLDSVLDKVLQLKPVSFIWRNSGSDDIGFVAQDVEPVFPGLVSTSRTEEEELKYLTYSKFGVLAIAAIQELRADYEARITALCEQLAHLQRMITSSTDSSDSYGVQP